MSKLKAHTDEIYKCYLRIRCFSGRVEKIVGKGENVGHQHFIKFKISCNVFKILKILQYCIIKREGTLPHNPKPFENLVGKGESAGSQHFFLFPEGCVLH